MSKFIIGTPVLIESDDISSLSGKIINADYSESLYEVQLDVPSDYIHWGVNQNKPFIITNMKVTSAWFIESVLDINKREMRDIRLTKLLEESV